MKYNKEELESINELREVFNQPVVPYNINKFEMLMLKHSEVIANDDLKDLELLRSVLSEENIQKISEETSKSEKKKFEIEINRIDEKVSNVEFNFLGSFASHPKNAKNNNLYRNTKQGIVYIYTNKWNEFIRDGKSDTSYIGGGLGERDVIELIGKYGGSGNFDGTIQATNVLVNNSNFSSIVGDNAQSLLTSIDNQIANKILFGGYLTRDMEEIGNNIYVGCENASGDWYVKKVTTNIDESLSLLYSNNFANGTNYDYLEGYEHKYSLNYVAVSGLGL